MAGLNYFLYKIIDVYLYPCLGSPEPDSQAE